MRTEEIEKILSRYINSELLALAREEGIPNEAIFSTKLFFAMAPEQRWIESWLLIKTPWQLSALGSGLSNYKAPVDWEQKDNTGATPAHYVAWSGHADRLDWMLQEDKGALTKKDGKNRTLMHYAAWSGNPDSLAWVFEKVKAKDKNALTKKDSIGRTAVHYAACSGNPACLAWVLQHDAEALTRTDNRDHDAMYYAIKLGNLESLAWVLEHDAEALTRETIYFHSTAVHHAAWLGNLDSLVWVLEHDAEALTRTDREGRTVVHYAAWSGNPACLALVLERDAKALTRTDREGKTAVHYAAQSVNPACLALVLERDAEALTRKDDYSYNAMDYATSSMKPANQTMLIKKNYENNNAIAINLREKLKTNFALTEAKYSQKIDPDIKATIERLLKRNQLLMTGLNAIEKPGKLGTFFSSDETTKAKQALFEKATTLKQQANSLKSDPEKAVFFEGVLSLSQARWSEILGLAPEKLNAPIDILKLFFNKLPEKSHGKINPEKAALSKILTSITVGKCETDWEKIANIIGFTIQEPTEKLAPLIDYFNYRKIIGIAGEPESLVYDNDDKTPKGLN